MKRAEWEARIKEQAGSGESVAEFCAKRGLTPGTFSYWKKELSKRRAERFVTVGADEIEIHLSGGTIIKSELRHLSSILKAIGACAG
jgi:hypothetical protein